MTTATQKRVTRNTMAGEEVTGTNSTTSTSNSLLVVKQTCLTEQVYTTNGVQKNVHVVVKNQPFTVDVLFNGNVTTSEKRTYNNFSSLMIEAILLYDTPDNSKKEVMFIKVKPLEYSGHIFETDPRKFTLEIFVKILSSQHEDSLFKVLLRAVDPVTKKPIPGLETTTKEILSISKPEVVRKLNEPRQKKRTRDEIIFDVLSRIENRLEQQQQTITSLQAEKRMRLETTTNPKPATASSKQVAAGGVSQVSDVSALNQFITAFHSLSQDKIRAVVNKLSPSDSKKLSETLHIFRETSEPSSPPSPQFPQYTPLDLELSPLLPANDFTVQSPLSDEYEEGSLYRDYFFLNSEQLAV